MANYLDVGSIAQPGADFPSTGPHLHVGVFDPSGKAIDPATARSFLLNRILVGSGKSPLFKQSGSGWQNAYPITSGFGLRESPIAGATSNHQGIDVGIPQGTQLAWNANPGDVYTPNKGFGSIQTTDPQGRPYTVKLLHTNPGGAAQVPQQTNQPSVKPGNITNNFYIGANQAKNNPDVAAFLNDFMINSLNYKSNIDPVALLQGAFQTPNYLT